MTDETRNENTSDQPDDQRTGPTERLPGDEPDEPKRLTRSGAGAVIGGVGSGLGRYFGVDPLLFRIGFVC
jgi:PspC domain